MDITQIAAINLRRSQLAVIGTTTDAGAGAGNSFIDTTLIGVGAGSFISMLAVLYPGQPTLVDSMAITGFATLTGEVTLASAYKGVAAPIPAGVPYMIVTFRFVAADVAALTANVGDASASALGSLYAILGNPSISLTSKINHVPKFTGNLWWVSTTGDDANDGRSPEMAFLTIKYAVSEAAAGDRIYVKAGTYDEADLDLNKVGLELVCEQGTLIQHTVTPGTVLIASADYCRVVGAIATQAAQTGFQITGNFCTFDDCLAFGSSIGFDDDGAENHLENCRSILHTATGFDISAGYGIYDRCIAAGGGVAVTGVLLSDAAADNNGFHDCHTLGNTTRGWDVVAGANNNLFSGCSTGAGDGAKRDLGTDNTWDDFSEGSRIVAGQTRDQDLKDIYNKVATLPVEQIPDTDFDGTVTDTETECVLVNLAYVLNKAYCLRHLRLKCADPGVGRTVTVKLYERWNDAIAQLIDSFDITPDNYETYHSLMDMFGVPEIHSDAILIRAVHDGASPADDKAIEVTYRYAEATT